MRDQDTTLPAQSRADCAVIIVAGGSGSRAADGGNAPSSADRVLPKQFWPLEGKPVISHSFDVFAAHPRVSHIAVVTAPAFAAMARRLCSADKSVIVTDGGSTRQQSVHNGLAALDVQLDAKACPLVLIHDAARPLLTPALLDRLLAAMDDTTAAGAVPVLHMPDSLKTLDRDPGAKHAIAVSGPDRARTVAAQTPQLFRRQIITDLHRRFATQDSFTDDCALAEAAGQTVMAVIGDKSLLKLTDRDDFAILSALLDTETSPPRTDPPMMMTETRTGTGFDVHAFGDGAGPIWVAGCKIDHDRSITAHSDGDVALHALCDAIFGALADGDIGAHFPPSDPHWKDADSAQFLAFAANRVAARGGRIVNLDVTIICEAPKIGPHRDAMRQRIAAICDLPLDRISVKATTSEQLGFTGRGEGIAAQASASITLPAD
jgi:2-C-methyl-D-erythritol 4-phosphate cytidylyltransferase/2-C-methyl-D-erythritol 2,4-cyclodiphosphate synthase